MDPSDEIKQLYFKATPKTIDRDLDRAIDLLKGMPDEGARERVAVYMDGLAQMRSEARGGGGGGRGGAGGGRQSAKAGAKTKKPGQPPQQQGQQGKQAKNVKKPSAPAKRQP